MEAFLIFCVLLAQFLTILAIIGLRKDLDFSNEDRRVRKMNQDVNDASNNLPPHDD